jgi:hypothetical protein
MLAVSYKAILSIRDSRQLEILDISLPPIAPVDAFVHGMPGPRGLATNAA